MSKRDVKGMTDAEIDIALTRLVTNCQKEARKAVKYAAVTYSKRLYYNAPQDPDSTNHSADHIVVTNVRLENERPQAEVGFSIKGYQYGWYMHFPDGGTIVRGTMGQPAQDFMAKTDKEMFRPIQAIMRAALKKGFDKI